jgi:hypothetical protein
MRWLAEFLVWGPEDLTAARIHASDESVDPSEIERMIPRPSLLLQHLAGTVAARPELRRGRPKHAEITRNG